MASNFRTKRTFVNTWCVRDISRKILICFLLNHALTLVLAQLGQKVLDNIYADAPPADLTVHEYCQLEMLQAECSEGHVLLFHMARYGRMRLGRCAQQDYGYVKCHTNVLGYLDRACSGRGQCEFSVADLHGTQPCPIDLSPFLETSYECVPVITGQGHKCEVNVPTLISSTSGYLASSITMDTGLGGPECPWRIQAHPGQQINLTLLNFARTSPLSPRKIKPQEDPLVSTSRPKICYQLAMIRDGHYPRPVTECEGSPRTVHVYKSTSNIVEIEVIVAKVLRVHFLIHFKAIGCQNPSTAPNTYLKRDGDSAVITCNHTGESQKLRCRPDGSWEGSVKLNCSSTTGTAARSENTNWSFSMLFSNEAFPYSILVVVSVGVALGVFVGGVLLVCAARYFRRRHDCITTDQYSPGTYRSSSTGCMGRGSDVISGHAPSGGSKTLVVSCDLATPTSQDLLQTDLRHLANSQHDTLQECVHCPFTMYDSLPRRGFLGPDIPVPTSGRPFKSVPPPCNATRLYECTLSEHLDYNAS